MSSIFSFKNFNKTTNKFYEECSDYYEYLYPDHLKYSVKFFNKIEPILKEKKVKKIIDVSCGVGHDMLTLLEKGYSVDGSDICGNMVRLATKNIKSKGFINSKLFECDVRKISEIVNQKTYDAVVFRGNTFSNIPPESIECVITNLLWILKNKGVLIVDFRSGKEQFKTKSLFELRGAGHLNSNGNLYFSFYSFKHSNDLTQPYYISAFIWFWKKFLLSKPSFKKFSINSFYVDDKAIYSCLNRKEVNYKSVTINHPKLPFLKSLLIFKNK